jgi:hypothetical protein
MAQGTIDSGSSATAIWCCRDSCRWPNARPCARLVGLVEAFDPDEVRTERGLVPL